MPTAVEHVTAAMERLTLQDVHDLPPRRRQQFAELCWHWFQLADGKTYRVVETGVLAQLKTEDGR